MKKNNNYKNLNLEILIVCEGMKCGLKLGKSRQKGFRDVLSSKLSKPTDRIWSLYNCEIIFFGIDGRGWSFSYIARDGRAALEFWSTQMKILGFWWDFEGGERREVGFGKRRSMVCGNGHFDCWERDKLRFDRVLYVIYIGCH